MADESLTVLRRRLRLERRALGAAQRLAAAVAVDAVLARHGLPRPGSRIAAYLPVDGELDTAPLIRRALALGCDVYLPVITGFRQRRMRFARLDANLRPNRWGIGEPSLATVGSARWLDLVIAPCVAFDPHGNRLGMGAGFYDRHFAFLRHRRAWDRPRLLGVGYQLQLVTALPTQPWDVPLWGVATERGLHGRAAGASQPAWREAPR